MNNTIANYEKFIYSVTNLSKHIKYSELVLIPISKNIFTLNGNIYFEKSIRIEIREALDFNLEYWITGYSYSVYRDKDRLYWYDSQPHPNDTSLQSTHPHHKHIPPDIKHNRIPASNLSFNKKNISFLISELEEILLNKRCK